MGIIIAAFIVLQPFIDIAALLVDLADAGITTTTFPFIAFYILLGNSMLEEFYFRGLLPISLVSLGFGLFYRHSCLPFIISRFFFRGSARHFLYSLSQGSGAAELSFSLPMKKAERFCPLGLFTYVRILAYYLSVSISCTSIE